MVKIKRKPRRLTGRSKTIGSNYGTHPKTFAYGRRRHTHPAIAYIKKYNAMFSKTGRVKRIKFRKRMKKSASKFSRSMFPKW